MLKYVCSGFLIGIIFISQPLFGQIGERDASLNVVTTWKGKNGVGFRGLFIGREGGILIIQNLNKNKPYKVNIINLHPDTKEWFLRAWKIEQEEKAGLKNSGEIAVKTKNLIPRTVLDLSNGGVISNFGYELVDEEKVDRSIVPNLNQADFGSKASDCVPNSYAMFLGWWHVKGWVRLPEKRRDYIEQMEWLHKEVARLMKTRNNSGTRSGEAPEALTKFFEKELESKAAFTYDFISNFKPENLAKYTQGANCTVLSVSVFYDDKYQSGHAVALKNIDPDGTIEFNTWGLSLKGKLKVIPETEKEHRLRIKAESGEVNYAKVKLPQYEIELMNEVDLPDWFVDNETRFVLDREKFDGLVVVTPYLPKEVEVGADEVE